jgi:ABC-2 type transport system permease protein/lipopolysaccharide transport system permease protein
VSVSAPPPELRFRRRVRLGRSLRELWRARELVFSLAERDLRARYKQAVLGFSWAVVTPLLLMVAFSLVFPRVANVDTGDVPYPLFSYLGLVPWAFFSTSVSQGGTNIINNAGLLNKVYCPREVFPIASVVVAAVDALIATVVLGVLFVIYSYAPQPESYWFPVLLAVQLTFTLGVTMALSAIMVYVRDIRHLLPIALQLGLFATPVAFSLDQLVPAGLQPLYVALNPLGAVIDGYRQTMLYGQQPDMQLLSIAAISATVMFLAAYGLFKRLETGFADVA